MADDIPMQTGNSMTAGELLLSRRIDDIVAMQKVKAPWYREGSLIVAIAAFFISILTTVVSGYHTYKQDVDSLKAQLRAAIQSSGQLVVENAEFSVKYKDEAPSMLTISTALNGQNIVLAREAYSVAKALGSSATSLDLSSAANALVNSNELVLAEDLLKISVARAQNANEYMGALRLLSGVQYQSGKHGEGAENFQKVLEVFRQYPEDGNNEAYVNITQAYSDVFWAGVVMASDCSLAKSSLSAAEQYLVKLPAEAPQAKLLRAQVSQMTTALANCK